MDTLTARKTIVDVKEEIATFIGNLFSFNNSLKLYHWHVTGVGSYSQHLSTDEAILSLSAITDRIAETSYATFGELDIEIPLTKVPTDIIRHCEEFYGSVDGGRELFPEIFVQSIIDDYQEAIQQLLYRLKRLQ